MTTVLRRGAAPPVAAGRHRRRHCGRGRAAALGTTARVAVWPPEHARRGAGRGGRRPERAGSAGEPVPAGLGDLLAAPQRRRPVHAQRRARRGDQRRAGGGALDRRAGRPHGRRAPSSRWATTATSPPSIPAGREPPAAPGPGAGLAGGPAGRPAAAPAGRCAGSTWAPPPRAWDPTARSGRSWPPPGTPAECWSAWAATSPSAGTAAARRLADPGGRPAGACQPARRRGAGPAGPAGPRGGRDLVDHLPRVAAGGPGAASHRGSPDRAARGRPVADGQRGRGDLRRRQRRRHGGDRRRGRGAGVAGRGGPARPGWSPATARCAASAAGRKATASRWTHPAGSHVYRGAGPRGGTR